ncbi:hypothetical protein CEXT_404941 [Caerostris extrusa]|uniref:Uncharacterized protein n=1 Tax=Caerostris extrusa TaxID=172846 RepID=A0AAV4NSQ1_CAEEX|nr:hypothetical protein CEXT_404941 [Caerostris extrusa]
MYENHTANVLRNIVVKTNYRGTFWPSLTAISTGSGVQKLWTRNDRLNFNPASTVHKFTRRVYPLRSIKIKIYVRPIKLLSSCWEFVSLETL